MTDLVSGPTSRRRFLGGAAVAGGAVVANPFSALAANAAKGRPVRSADSGEGDYGPLGAVDDAAGTFRRLALPDGFSFRTFGVEGDMMGDGVPTPKAHDGMGAFALPNGNVRLIRNHEDRNTAATATVKGDPATAYDERGGGGTSSLEVRQLASGDVELVTDFMSLNGTFTNCAGGPTPQASWITCEETTAGVRQGYTEPHGYCFEVPASATDEVTPVPLKAMGRFEHEAVAVDPRTGIVYETEDAGRAGLYRFIPDQAGVYSEGRLQMLAVKDHPNYDTRTGQTVGLDLRAIWVDIADPNPASIDTGDTRAVFNQGAAAGGATFVRLEGIWEGGRSIFFSSTTGGDAGFGQVWEYMPAGRSGGGILRLLFESPGIEVLDNPDNVTVAPGGGVLLCEDGRAANLFLRGLTKNGKIFDFAQNLFNGREWCGACWSPDGQTLFANVMGDNRGPDTSPPSSVNLGVTMAIWGPWERGAF